jgi:hypothetical protein
MLPPIVSGSEPTNPQNDQHWFDLNEGVYKVFLSNKWQVRLRCFAAIYDRNATIVPYPIGSQVGLNNTRCFAGNILLGKNNKPLRDSDGTFVTSESNLVVTRTSAETIKFDSILTYAEAAENIPAFSLVSFSNTRKVTLASFLDTKKIIHGIVTSDLSPGEVGQIISNGLIRNEQWNFQASEIGKSLFCGASGEITTIPPISGILQQVGFVYDTDSVYINLFAPVKLTNT